MKKTFFFLLLALLLTVVLSASAVFVLPEGLTAIDESAFEGDTSLPGRIVLPAAVQTVDARAFADTSVHALVLPEGCVSADSTVLAQTGAAYLQLVSATTRLNAAPADVAYIFAPAFGSASGFANFYASETLVSLNGFYYSVTEGTAVPLCAVDSNVSGVVTLPKLVSGQPIRALDTLILNGCEGMTALRVPAYLTVPAGMSATPYATMTVASPTASVTSAEAGDTVTWTTTVTGAYGEVAYVWDFTVGGTREQRITEAPSISYTLPNGGDCTVTVTVTDEVGDTAAAPSAVLPVNGSSTTVYRALLIGNSYTGTANEMKGSAADVSGMRAMLGRMTATPYRISTKSELSADGLVSAIRSTFADATVNDVSLIYFAGHGTNALNTSYHGSLLGVDGSYLTIARLRSVLDEIPGKKIVIVDACYSGQLIGKGSEPEPVSQAELNAFNSNVISAFSASTQSRGANDLATSSYYVITAAHSTEESKSMGYDPNGDGVMDKYFGLFTYSLCYGSGWNMATNVERAFTADVDGNGQITLFEAYAFARNKALQSNPNQTAQVYPANSTMIVWAK